MRVTLHENGRDIVAKRMDDADIQRADDEAAVIAQRFKDQKQSPGTEAGCYIEGLQRGEPDFTK